MELCRKTSFENPSWPKDENENFKTLLRIHRTQQIKVLKMIWLLGKMQDEFE